MNLRRYTTDCLTGQKVWRTYRVAQWVPPEAVTLVGPCGRSAEALGATVVAGLGVVVQVPRAVSQVPGQAYAVSPSPTPAEGAPLTPLSPGWGLWSQVQIPGAPGGANGGSGINGFDSGQGPVPVPEPGSLALMGGLLVVAGVSRLIGRKRK